MQQSARFHYVLAVPGWPCRLPFLRPIRWLSDVYIHSLVRFACPPRSPDADWGRLRVSPRSSATGGCLMGSLSNCDGPAAQAISPLTENCRHITEQGYHALVALEAPFPSERSPQQAQNAIRAHTRSHIEA